MKNSKKIFHQGRIRCSVSLIKGCTLREIHLALQHLLIRWITHLEMFVTFWKTNVALAKLLQPSVVVGNIGGTGRGWPKTIQNKNNNAVRAPTIAPLSVADSVPMPSVKMPSSGPPTTPKIVKEAYDKRNLFYRYQS